MNKYDVVLREATRAFEFEGFRGIGIDRLLAASGISTRTLYKHFGSRDGLVVAVLEARHQTFMDRVRTEADDVDPVGSLFATQRRWLEEHGARGCLLLRARGEYTAASSAIVGLVRQQKHEFRIEVSRRVAKALGRIDDALATRIWLIFEGAVAGTSVADLSVFDEAAQLARSLVDRTGRP